MTKSKTILITGATGNLGQAVLQRFLKDGYRVLAAVSPGRVPENLYSPDVDVRQVDLTDESAVEEFLHAALEAHPGLEAAIMLVGGFAPGRIEEANGAALDKMIALNFKTAFFLARPLLKWFESRPGGGRFVFVGSRPALNPAEGKNFFAYALSKSLVFRLGECINEAGKGKNITATVVVPSTIDTPANRAAMPDADFSKWVKAEYLADTIAFVLSDAGGQLRDSVLKVYNEA